MITVRLLYTLHLNHHDKALLKSYNSWKIQSDPHSLSVRLPACALVGLANAIPVTRGGAVPWRRVFAEVAVPAAPRRTCGSSAGAATISPLAQPDALARHGARSREDVLQSRLRFAVVWWVLLIHEVAAAAHGASNAPDGRAVAR